MKSILPAGLAAALLLAGSPSLAEVRSVSRIEFGPSNVLFVADWKGANVHVVSLPATSAPANKPFNLLDIQTAIAQQLSTRDFSVEDLKTRPGSGEVYLAVTYGPDSTPAVLTVAGDGSVHKVDLSRRGNGSHRASRRPRPAISFFGTESPSGASP